MQAALAFFAPDMPVVVFPAWDCLPYDRVSPQADVSAARMATLAGLVHGMPPRFVLLTTLNAATQRVPAREVLRDAAFRARVGDRIDEAALKAFLLRMGFSQTPTVMEAGDYAVRGGIIGGTRETRSKHMRSNYIARTMAVNSTKTRQRNGTSMGTKVFRLIQHAIIATDNIRIGVEVQS